MIQIIIVSVLGLLMVLSAILAVVHKNLKVAILSAGLVSLMASVLYAILDAPDLALTEAGIGSAITTFIFFVVLNKISRIVKDDKENL